MYKVYMNIFTSLSVIFLLHNMVDLYDTVLESNIVWVKTFSFDFLLNANPLTNTECCFSETGRGNQFNMRHTAIIWCELSDWYYQSKI